MELLSEISDALKLFFLSALFLWSCTWNSSGDLDLSRAEPGKRTKAEHIDYVKNGGFFLDYNPSVITESFSCEPGELSGCANSARIPIPSFEEWKEKEMTKQEKSLRREEDSHPNRRSNRRKLNYASSKCGAKILASNPEARHRTAVLSEKSDEYLLNPCRVGRTWFVVELCDTVEATQVELANYELYSSSPREFSVFWSEVYPAVTWHPLGTFEAKDQRTMQTFDVSVKNLGKFVKVVVSNHHGKEHYCPLSVIRVLGYSMVQKLEDIEEEDESNLDSTSKNRAESLGKARNPAESIPKDGSRESLLRSVKGASLDEFNLFPGKICSLFFKHCSNATSAASKKLCFNRPTCLFFWNVLKKEKCCEVFCTRSCGFLSSPFDSFEFRTSNSSSNLTFSQLSKSRKVNGTDGMSDNIAWNRTDVKYYRRRKSHVSDFSFDKNVDKYEGFKSIRGNASTDEIFRTVENGSSVAAEEISVKPSDPFRGKQNGGAREKCVCEKNPPGTVLNKEMSQGMVTEEENENGGTIDSATLIQKESVLFKLTTRIKASETNLSLINKYLQQLSRYYRFQMEDMKTMFNHTVRVIGIASEKAQDINSNQEKNIRALQETMRVLNRKIDYLTSGQRDLLKRAIELHGFFLVLEFIVVSTIFTVFLNIFRRRNALVENRNLKLMF